MKEIWKIVEDFPDYQISNFGSVKSLKFEKERILTPIKNNVGYLHVNLYINGKRYTKDIHRLVLEAFKPNKDLNKNECNHEDGNKDNNYVENLEWCTHSENIKHAFKIGLMNIEGENNPMFGKQHSEKTRKKQSERMKGKYLGEKNPNSTLTEKNVIKIRIDLKEGILTQKEIGEKFGVDQTTISDIKNNRRWKYIKEI